MEATYERPQITMEVGQVTPEVDKVRGLGLLIKRNRVNGDGHQAATKAATATRLVSTVSNRRMGMKEESFTRVVHQSFTITHISFATAFHNWRPCERTNIDATLRKAYQRARRLLWIMNTDTVMALGVHNTFYEIAEAQRTAQLARLFETSTGRHVFRHLYLTPTADSTQGEVPLPDNISQQLNVCRMPQNMNPEHNKERGLARAKPS